MDNNTAQLWLGDSFWQNSSFVVKGFYSHLVLLASQKKPFGVVVNNDKIIRKALGLPTKNSVTRCLEALNKKKQNKDFWIKEILSQEILNQETLNQELLNKQPLNQDNSQKKTVTQNNLKLDTLNYLLDPFYEKIVPVEILETNFEVLVDYLWENFWRRDLFNNGFVVIDDSLILKFPHLKNNSGDYFSNIAYKIATDKLELQTTISPISTKKKKRNNATSILSDFDFSGFDILRDRSLISSVWGNVLSQNDKESLWRVGFDCLHVFDKDKAGKIIGKMIKEYGEKNLFDALIELKNLRHKPKDPISYLTASLTKNVYNPEYKARLQRSKVAI